MGEWLKLTGAVAGYALYYLSSLAGIVLIPIGLPGQFVVVLGTLVLTP